MAASFSSFRSGTETFQVLTEEFTPDSWTSTSFLTAELRQPIRIQDANPRVWNKVIPANLLTTSALVSVWMLQALKRRRRLKMPQMCLLTIPRDSSFSRNMQPCVLHPH